MSVDLAPSADEQLIEHAFTSFFAKEAPIELVRRSEPLGFDRELWSKLAAIDAQGLALPEHVGGSGATMGTLVVAIEALGRVLAPVPLIEHAVASRALDQPGRDLVDGTAIATIALRPAESDGRWRLVPAGAVADVVIGIDGDQLVAVRSAPPGSAPRNHASAPLADRSAREGERTVIGTAAGWSTAVSEWRLLTAAALVGIAARALELAVEYVTVRHQFGRPVGSFQAVQHGLADLPGLVDGARLLVRKAAWAAERSASGVEPVIDVDDNDVTDFPALARMAFVFAADVAAKVTDHSLHYHGGYGFAEEGTIQLFYRRARGWPLVLGDPSTECLDLADTLFGAPAVTGRRSEKRG